MCADINIYKELHLNKAELIAAIADDAEISKAKAEFALNSAIEQIIKTVTKGDTVQLIGFGTFASGKRAARMGRNPKLASHSKSLLLKLLSFLLVKHLKIQ